MRVGNNRVPLALVALSLIAWPLANRAVAEDARDSTAPKSAAKRLVPFPEDEPSAAPKAAPTRVPLPPPGSNFRPRFKSPAVKQAQHAEAEPAGSAEPSEKPAGEGLQPVPMPADALDSAGRGSVDEAFAKSKVAKSENDYTEVIELCRRGRTAGLKKSYEDYARKLMAWAYNRRGESLVDAGRDKEALADFEAAVENNPTSWRSIHNRAVSYASLGRTKEAMNDFNRTIALNAKYPNAFFNRAELRYSQGDFAGALADYSLAITLKPDDPSILNNRGHALYRMRRFGEALRDYSAALKLDPKFGPALVNRGDTYCDLGQYGDAANDYRAAVEADPKLGRGYQAAAWLMATCPDDHYRNDKMALQAARKAIELDGTTDFRYLETLAAAEANSGDFNAARQTQEQAIAKAPRGEMVAAEKRMALYGRELAYRERPRVAFRAPEDQPDKNVRQASGTSPIGPRGRPNGRSQ